MWNLAVCSRCVSSRPIFFRVLTFSTDFFLCHPSGKFHVTLPGLFCSGLPFSILKAFRYPSRGLMLSVARLMGWFRVRRHRQQTPLAKKTCLVEQVVRFYYCVALAMKTPQDTGRVRASTVFLRVPHQRENRFEALFMPACTPFRTNYTQLSPLPRA